MGQFDIFSGIGLTAWAAIAGILILCIYGARKISFGILDPWFGLAVSQVLLVAIASALYFKGVLKPSYYFYWLGATAMFLLPFAWLKPQRFPLYAAPSPQSIQYARFVNLLIILLSLYQFVLDIVFIANRGIPVLYQFGSNGQIYMGGFGIVKYVHDANMFLLPPLAVYSFFISRKTKFLILGILAAAYPSLFFEWSKLGLYNILLYLWIASMFFFGPSKFLRKLYTVGIVACLPFVFFMFSRIAAAGYGGGNTLDAFQTRMVQSGDSIYMYFVLDTQASIPKEYTFPKYISSYISPYLSYVSPYFVRDASDTTDSIGHVILTAAGLPTAAGSGPAPPFQVVGHIFMKYYGFVYGFFIGFILYRVKSKIGSIKQEHAVIFLTLYNCIHVIAGDASLFTSYLFIYIFLLPPVVMAFLLDAALPKQKIVIVAK